MKYKVLIHDYQRPPIVKYVRDLVEAELVKDQFRGLGYFIETVRV